MSNPTSKPDSMRLPSRKRSHSTAEAITLSIPVDTKRMRLGIQELSTNPQPERSHLRTNSHSSAGAETNEPNDSASLSSSTLDSGESTSSSSSDESSGAGIDEGYDSDFESGSTTTSSSSSSSGEESSGQDDGEMRAAYPGPSMSLAEKLHSFLPRMAAANAELDDARAAGRLMARNMENVQEGAMHIEMHLGLGVLEEKRDVNLDGSDNDGDESEGASVGSRTSTRSKSGDAMAVLMGRKAQRKPGILVMDAKYEK